MTRRMRSFPGFIFSDVLAGLPFGLVSALLASVFVAVPLGTHAQTDAIEEGRVRDGDSGSLYHFWVSDDSTIHIRREGPPSNDSSLAIPPELLKSIHDLVGQRFLRPKQQFPSSEQESEYFSFSYQDESLMLGFAKRFNLYVLVSLIVIVVVGSIVLVRLRRRLARERRRREALAQSQRYLTKGREKERARLAQEIHDGPVQDLHGLHMKISALSHSPDPDTISDELMRITSELRAMSADLHPPALQRFGLPAALRSHADRLSERHTEIEFSMDLPGECMAMPDEYALSLFRIAQEAMNNAVQHGETDRVDLRLDCTDETITLTVKDDGTGFSLPDDWYALAEEEHYGLIGMRERADAINATLDIESDPNVGTCIRLYGSVKEFEARTSLTAETASVAA